MFKWLFTALFICCGLTFAQVEPVPGASVFESIIAFLSSVEGATATIAVVLEFVFRMFPTKKPLSLLHGFAAILVFADFWLMKASQIVKKSAQILDKVLPQNSEEK